MIVDIRAYEKFAKQYLSFPPLVRYALRTFLEHLQQVGPFDSSMSGYENAADQQYSYEFFPGHAVFWKVVDYESANMVTPTEDQLVFLRLTAIGLIMTHRQSSGKVTRSQIVLLP